MSGSLVLLLLLDLFFFIHTATSLSTTPYYVLALNAKCRVKPEQREAWIAAIQENQLCTRRDEPGNLQFVVGQDVDDENTFYLHEEFQNIAAFQDHCASPHFCRYDEFCNKSKKKAPLDGDLELVFYHPRDDEPNEHIQKRPIHKNAFGLSVNLYPKASVRDEFLTVISNNKEGTDTTEDLALQYTYGESATVEGFGAEGAENTFHFHEQYAGENHGKEGFEAHTSAPHFSAWEEFVGTDPFEKDPEVFFYRILEP
mmetsp:Transcript_5650/g.8187  ORF Transcript_5650/g.8187 Transcript_5650/m.8187 type:complete len:256 (+) Transcript_5650:58-825(+)